ncbi:MAG: phosphonate C-P lyase system protein PhnH [Pseudomonadota bacterium]
MSMAEVNLARFNEESLLAADNFRLLLDSMAKPGTVRDVPPSQNGIDKLNAGAAMSLLVLSDHETSVWLHEELATKSVADYLRFQCGCPLVDHSNQAMFAVFPALTEAFELNEFSWGTPYYPDRSTTLIMQVEELGTDGPFVLTGPGINVTQSLQVEGLSSKFWDWRAAKNKDFPLGVDVIFTTDTKLAALPRTTQVKEIG